MNGSRGRQRGPGYGHWPDDNEAAYRRGPARARHPADYGRRHGQDRSPERERYYARADYGRGQPAEEWEAEQDLFGGGAGPRYFWTGRYGMGGANSTGGYSLGDLNPSGGYGSFQTAGGYGATTLYGAEQAMPPDYPSMPPGYAGPQRPGSTQRIRPRFPKGYQRSDEKLREDICERLIQDPRIDVSDVSVDVQGGAVSLTGSVPERYMKHAIEDMADAAPGVQEIDNRIRVKRAAE